MTLFTVTGMFGIHKGPSTLPEMKMLMLLDISMSRQIHKKIEPTGLQGTFIYFEELSLSKSKF